MLHIASWYPNSRDPQEGRFIADRIEGLRPWCEQEVIHLQLKHSPAHLYYSNSRKKGFSGFILQSRWLRWKWLEELAPRLLLRQLKHFKVSNFDIVVVHVAYPVLVNFRTIRRHIPCPVILSEHWSAYHNKFYLPDTSPAIPRIRKMLDAVDGMIVVSHALNRDIRALCEFSGPTAVVPNPVDGSLFFIQSDAVRTGFMAINRWVKIKQPMVLLKAWLGFVRQYPLELLTIAGDGPEISAMKEFVRNNQLEDSVRFTGVLSAQEVAKEMKSKKALVVSSQYETFSLSSAESLMCGTPLVSVKLEAVQEYACAEDAVFADGNDADALNAALNEFQARRRPWDHQSISSRAHARFDKQVSDEQYFRTLKQFATTA